ncbi:MAG: T9SS type A sorting domain-containing protein [Bacteroidetes bacterium]|nr:T9SS type A sorting domain-containing protein [Bacteroidota bacterium]
MKLFSQILIFGNLMISLSYFVAGQSFRMVNDIPVIDIGGDTLAHAWGGGNNTTQFSDIDLNFDGKKDLVIFNRDGSRFSAYVNEGSFGEISYRYSPELTASFDSCDCIEWALLEDYNCDGREDIFCGASAGQNFQVYDNVVYNGDSIGFVRTYETLLSQSSTLSPLYQDRTDIPIIADLDYDGDLDIVASQSGFNTFALHLNVAMEDYGTCDTMVFKKKTFCWGNFIEGNSSNSLILGDTMFCPRGSGTNGNDPSGSRHSGSTLLALEMTGDSLMDLLIGDISYPTVNALFNHGTLNHAFMDSAEFQFPQSDSSIDVQLFPAMFHLDVDNDNIRDLVITPNETIIGENVNGSVVYLNHGLDNNPDFRFASRGFITSKHVDVGFRSVPELFDYNGDGLMDLFIGGGAAYMKNQDTVFLEKQFHLYENTGTAAKPVFQLVDSNYLDLDNIFPPIFNVAPAFGDLDGDGDKDLIAGNVQGTLIYFQNIASSGNPANFSLGADQYIRDINGDSIDIGSHSAPELVDIDNDGDLDLFIGENFGKIVFYRNNGSPTQYQFALETKEWGFVKVSNQYNSLFSGSAKPEFFDYDMDGKLELLVGAESGEVVFYDNLETAATDTLKPVESFFHFDFGDYAAPEVGMIDESGKPVYIVGNDRGGISLIRFDPGNGMTDTDFDEKPEKLYTLYPNPSTGVFQIDFLNAQSGSEKQVQVFNTMGQLIMQKSGKDNRLTLDLSRNGQGVYYAKIRTGTNRYYTEKIVISD